MIICLEAIDGAGKTTQVKLLEQYIKKTNDFRVQGYHFPTTSVFGDLIYQYLNGDNDYSKEVIELLQTADKMNRQEYIKYFKDKPHEFLILDRYNLSQYAYALASGLDKEWTLNLMSQYTEPDIKIFLNISPTDTFQRKKENFDKYESDFHFQLAVYRNYLEGCSRFGYNIVDATRNIEEIHKDIVKIVENKRGVN